MKQFGYLPTGAPNTEALHAEEAITEAVKRMQLFGGLEPSGVPNKETIKVHSSFLIDRQVSVAAAFKISMRKQGRR